MEVGKATRVYRAIYERAIGLNRSIDRILLSYTLTRLRNAIDVDFRCQERRLWLRERQALQQEVKLGQEATPAVGSCC